MNASASLLIILRSHERIRTQYQNGITSAFPALKVDVVAKAEDADPYLADCDIIITHGPHLADKADHVFSKAKKLRWVQGIGTGVDNIADRPSLRDDVIVTNIHGVHGRPMSEAAVSLMLALSRKLPRSLENKAKHKWENWPSRLLSEKTVGIFGLGSIAETMAPVFKAFNMTVVGITSGIRPMPGFDEIVDKSRLIETVSRLDYFVVLTPYTPAADGFDDADGAFLAANGLSAVRVGIIWKALEPEPGVFNDAYLASIESTVNMLGSHGIVSLLDFHQDMYNERFQGEGAPDWAVDQASGVRDETGMLLLDASTQTGLSV